MKQLVKRFDDWVNTFSSLGSIRDKAVGLTFRRRPRLSRETLEAMYEQHPIAARVIDRLPDDALREGWTLKEIDADIDIGKILSRLDDLHINSHLQCLIRWGRLYGGAIMTLPVTDGQTPEHPLDLSRPLSYQAPIVVSAYDAEPLDMDATFGSPTYQKVLFYNIQNIDGRLIRIHHSRVVVFEPIILPYEALLKSPTGYGPSVLDRLFDDIGREGSAKNYAVSMMYIASLIYVQMDGFRASHSSNAGRENIRNLLISMRQGMDSLGLLGIDAADKIGVLNLSMQGVNDLIEKMKNSLAAAADMPKEILFNESPAGLNAGQLSGPQELWFAHVKAFQKHKLTPLIDRILECLFAAWGMDINSWQIEWNQLWTKSDMEQAQTALVEAQSDQIYYNIGAATEEEIRAERLEKGAKGPLRIASAPILDLSKEMAGYEASYAQTQNSTSSGGEERAQGLIAIVEKVAAGTLPRDSAIRILSLTYPELASQAEAILGSVGVQLEQPIADDEQELEQAPYAPPAGEKLMTAQSIGEEAGISPNTIHGMHKRGLIQGWKPGGVWLYVLSDILKAAHRPIKQPQGSEVNAEETPEA